MPFSFILSASFSAAVAAVLFQVLPLPVGSPSVNRITFFDFPSDNKVSNCIRALLNPLSCWVPPDAVIAAIFIKIPLTFVPIVSIATVSSKLELNVAIPSLLFGEDCAIELTNPIAASFSPFNRLALV